MFIRLIIFELFLFVFLFLLLKFFIDKRYLGPSIKVFLTVVIFLIVAQTATLFVLSSV